MKKNITQDIVPPKKTIRDVELPSRVKEEVRKGIKITKNFSDNSLPSIPRPETPNTHLESESPLRIPDSRPASAQVSMTTPTTNYKYSYDVPPRRSKMKYIVTALGLSAVFLAFFVSAFFKSATVTVTPITEAKAINESFTAKKDISATGLNYQVVTVTKDMDKAIDAKDVGSEQKVERKAKGIIVVYNNFGTAPQKLVATTRFQTQEGLVYRLVNAVTVPGKYLKDGKMVPGSVEAEVVADQVGQNYNIGLKDFTVPGLKSDSEKYKTIFARSKTEMTGGFSGIEKVVSKEALTRAESEMESILKPALSKDVMAQIPADFVVFQDSLEYKFEPAVSTNTPGGTVVAKKKGTVTAIIFDKKTLSKEVTSKVLPDVTTDTIKIANIDSLNFKLATSSSAQQNSITFTLQGEANFVWYIDEAKLKSDLLGLSKSNANSVMSAYTSIKEAWVLTRPFWNTKIPTDPNRVKIINTEAQKA